MFVEEEKEVVDEVVENENGRRNTDQVVVEAEKGRRR